MQYPDVFYSENSFPKINCSILIVFLTHILYISEAKVLLILIFFIEHILKFHKADYPWEMLPWVMGDFSQRK